MPANLTPQFMAAEERFRAAKSADEKIEALEEMLAVIPLAPTNAFYRFRLGDLYLRVGMIEHVSLKPLQQCAEKRWFAPGILGLGIHRAGVAVALDDILHRALGDSETLGDSPHALAVFHARRHDSLAKIYGCWSHAQHYTS